MSSVIFSISIHQFVKQDPFMYIENTNWPLKFINLTKEKHTIWKWEVLMEENSYFIFKFKKKQYFHQCYLHTPKNNTSWTIFFRWLFLMHHHEQSLKLSIFNNNKKKVRFKLANFIILLFSITEKKRKIVFKI